MQSSFLSGGERYLEPKTNQEMLAKILLLVSDCQKLGVMRIICFKILKIQCSENSKTMKISKTHSMQLIHLWPCLKSRDQVQIQIIEQVQRN